MMPSLYWIKMYPEILDDPKMGQLSDFLWRRAIELFLLAGKNGNGGLLQPVTEMAWILRVDEDRLSENLRALAEVGVVHETPAGWFVTNFVKRQARVPDNERQSQYRQRQRNEPVTNRNIDIESESDKEIEKELESESFNTAKKPAVKKPAVIAAINTPKENTPQQEMVRILSDATGMDYKIKQNAGRLAKVGSELLKAGYTPLEVLSYYSLNGCWWQQCDWRGLQGQYPTPEQVLQTISIARKGIIKPTGKMTPQEKTQSAFDSVRAELAETGSLSWQPKMKP